MRNCKEDDTLTVFRVGFAGAVSVVQNDRTEECYILHPSDEVAAKGYMEDVTTAVKNLRDSNASLKSAIDTARSEFAELDKRRQTAEKDCEAWKARAKDREALADRAWNLAETHAREIDRLKDLISLAEDKHGIVITGARIHD